MHIPAQDCIETATFKDQPDEEKERLLHMVVVGAWRGMDADDRVTLSAGGGPTGIEYAGELPR